jgi:hypothetical protein
MNWESRSQTPDFGSGDVYRPGFERILIGLLNQNSHTDYFWNGI